jgi:leucyl/phenylalanyl-tRNA--protein transferase
VLTWIDDENQPLPPGREALGADEGMPGLAAVGGQLTPARLEEAYRKGLFPWFSEGQPVLWWSPEPRMVLPVADFKLSRSLRKTLRRFVHDSGCALRVDSAFDTVIQACADAPRDGQNGTWIVPAMVAAYRRWHRLGRTHSVETWVDGRLVGGLYGVAIGRMFFGESMFARASDASKIALAGLICLCREHGVPLIDCQQNTRHLASLGARAVSRAAFDGHLQKVLMRADVGDWTYHSSFWRHLLGPPDPADPAGAPARTPP